MSAPTVVVLSQGGLETARSLRAALPGTRIHGLVARVGSEAGTADNLDELFDNAADHIRALFAAGRPVIGVCAAGILIRAVAPLLGDKHTEPPVVAVAEDGSTAVPLLGGHHGANDLARRIAEALGGHPAITTAGDVRFGVALDQPPTGWRLANPERAKDVMAALLAGSGVSIEGSLPWLPVARLPAATASAPVVLRATERADIGDAATLVYHPAVLTVGVGCERDTDPAELLDLVRGTLRDAGLAEGAVAGIFSLNLKADEPAVHAVARELGVPARFLDAATLEAQTPRLATPSEVVFQEVGCHGVSEGAALAAAGPDGTLLVAKRKSPRATVAVARAPQPVAAGTIGRPRGRLSIVGIGPGRSSWRTPEARAWLARATDLVGYHLYLDLLGPLAEGKARHGYELGAEEMRCRIALDLAAAGREVALVSSGDAGIYAMATLVFELLEREDRPDWRRVDVAVTPGISAFQAAAARIGAPMGHDFCTISLSDLLTPWPVIEQRIQAAAAGDFVIAVYNPVSRKRTTQLERMRDIVLTRRPAATPVVLARNLGREGEMLRVVTLGALDPAEVDMLTLVLIGSSETRAFPRGSGRNNGSWVYTPRGYAAKFGNEQGGAA